MKKLGSLLGQRFSHWLVIEPAPKDARGRERWLCECSCGKRKAVDSYSLRKGTSTACGCLADKKTAERSRTHGLSHHKLFGVWWSLQKRCDDPKNKRFNNYGGRGIGVCDRWRSFQAFYEDMGASWKPGLSIERIDVNGDYCPGNCCWVSAKEQARNKTNNRMVCTAEGVVCVAEAAEKAGIKYHTFYARCFKGGQL